VADVRAVIANGEVIAEYSDDQPYPSFLLLGFTAAGPLHVVVARELVRERCIVVTAYAPGKDRWETGFKIRRLK
jgi:hypothetical protein